MIIRTAFVRIGGPDQLDKNNPIGQIAILALDKEYNKVYTINMKSKLIGTSFLFVYWDKKARVLEFCIFNKPVYFYIKETIK